MQNPTSVRRDVRRQRDRRDAAKSLIDNAYGNSDCATP